MPYLAIAGMVCSGGEAGEFVITDSCSVCRAAVATVRFSGLPIRGVNALWYRLNGSR